MRIRDWSSDVCASDLSRRDEIGLLARALSDRSHALRQRIDATEAFAADVTHELKNPIASLRSALEALGTIEAADLRAQLMEIANDDVRRLDRLVTDIAEASRVDAQLSRAKFDSRSEEHTSELQSLMRISYAVFCLKKKNNN